MAITSPFQRALLFLVLSLSTFMMVLDYSVANVSIPYIAGSLAVSVDQGTYVITSFAVGNAIGLALTGWLSKRYGQIRLMVVSVLLFTVFSALCGASTSIMMLVVSRFIQGLVSGPIIPMSQSLIINTGTEKSRSKDLAIYSMIIITAPVLGPILGGYISDWYSWSWIFYINVPVGFFCALVIWQLLKKSESQVEKTDSDIWGIVLLSLGVMSLQILLDKGQQWDWLNSNVILTLMLVAIISFVFLIIREFSVKKPVLDLRLFSIPSFSLSVFCLSISYAIYFGTIVLIPLWLQQYMGYNAVWAGVAISTVGIGPVLFSLVTPHVIRKIGNVSTLILGFTIFSIACFYTSTFTAQATLIHISVTRCVFGLAFIFYINPLLGMNIQDVPKELLPSATGIFHFIRAMVGGIGASVFTTIWERRTIFHYERIASTLTEFNPMTPAASTLKAKAILDMSVDQQASVLAINDCFYLMGYAFLGLIVILAVWQLFFSHLMQKKTAHEVEHPTVVD